MMGKNDATPPRTAYDTMQLAVPPIAELSRQIANRFRSRPGWPLLSTITREELTSDGSLPRFVTAYAIAAMDQGSPSEVAENDGNMLGQHLFAFINYELHRRKTFWVDASLAWMLKQTQLDIEGEVLNLPFPCSAFVFNDPASLELGKAVLRVDQQPDANTIKVITVYVTRIPATDGAQGIAFQPCFDWLDGRWPYLLSRDVVVAPRAHLDEILDSHFSTVDVQNLDPVFTCTELKDLLHLVINAILYTTCADVNIVPISSPVAKLGGNHASQRPRRARAAEREIARLRNKTTGEDVFFLPGKIDIRQVHEMQKLDPPDDAAGSHLMTRFMVRGHWRHPNPAWKDRRMRWIEPYWKGPDIATIIEREYRLRR